MPRLGQTTVPKSRASALSRPTPYALGTVLRTHGISLDELRRIALPSLTPSPVSFRGSAEQTKTPHRRDGVGRLQKEIVSDLQTSALLFPPSFSSCLGLERISLGSGKCQVADLDQHLILGRSVTGQAEAHPAGQPARLPVDKAGFLSRRKRVLKAIFGPLCAPTEPRSRNERPIRRRRLYSFCCHSVSQRKMARRPT